MRVRMISRALLASALPSLVSAQAPLEEVARADASRVVREEMVITNQNLALVTETRRANLPAGRFDLLWEGAPSSAKPETWTVSAPDTRSLGVEWTGFGAAAPDSADWLKRLIGRRVRVTRPGGATVEADVLEVHGSTPDLVLFREGADLVYGEPHASLSLAADAPRPRRPAGLYLKLSTTRGGEREVTSRYLLANVGWQADYALTLGPDERSGRLDGWFTVDNAAGEDFSPNRLRLLAGVLRVAGEGGPRPLAAARAGVQAIAPSSPVSESRLYEVAAPGVLRAGRTTFPLAENVAVELAKRYVVRATVWAARNPGRERVPVAVQYRVRTAPLSRALPAGMVRVYSESGSFFAGEDRIAHVPEGTDVDVETSEAFDLTAERVQTAFAQVGARETESSYEVTVASRKKENVTVLIRETFAGDWTVLESSVPVSRPDASTAEFALPVAAGSIAKLTYRVRVRLAG